MSKLGGHFMSGGNPQPWVEAGARIFKFAPEVLGMSSQIPAGPLVIGKLDQQDTAIGLTDWKAMMKQGFTPEAAANLRFNAQRNIYVGANKPRVDRYLANPRVDVWEDDNEIMPDNQSEAVWYAEYCVKMMQFYETLGKKRANFLFAVGTPDMNLWPHLLPAVRHARDHEHYIALHEYMGYEADYGVGWKQIDANHKPIQKWHGRADGKYPWGWAALRYRYLYDTVFAQAGLGDAKLLITELGCDSVESVTPAGMPVGTWKEHAPNWESEGRDPEETYADMLAWYDGMIRQDSYVIGATVFTIGSVGVWKNWDIVGTGVETRLLAHVVEGGTDDPLPVPAPSDPPPMTVPPVNRLTNGNFEGGWYHPEDENGYPIPELQLPVGWTLKWRDGKDLAWQNPFDSAEHARFVRPEIRTLPVEQLPPHEQELFVRDGRYTLKAFKGNGAFYFSLMQTVALTAGKWRLSAPIYADLVEKYEGGRKVWADDPNVGLWRVRVGPIIMSGTPGVGPFGGGWVRMISGQWNEVMAEFEISENSAEVKIDFLLPFALPQNGIFADGWTLTAVEGVEPADPPTGGSHKAIILKLPQDVTATEWAKAAEYAYDFRHTMTASHDDTLTVLRGGNAESFVKLAFPTRQPDVADLIKTAGYRWEPLFAEAPAQPFSFSTYPVEGDRVVTQAFGARPEIYSQYGFPGHEGTDLRATLDAPVRAVASGLVSKITTTGNYGNRIDIRHDGGWITTYAHLNRFAGLPVGAAVAAGSIVGYAGSTGNSTGVHLHLGLKRDGHTYTDSAGVVWPFNVFDPTPYLKPFLTAPPTVTIDLLPYLKGDGRVYMVRHPLDGSQEKFRTVDKGDRWLILKNNQWEELWLSGDYIWRGKDTSAGDGQYYRQFEEGKEGARWCPRRMAIGQTWTAPVEHTVQTYRKDGCTPVAHHRNGTAVNRVKLVAKYSSRRWNGISVEDVIELATHTGEQMWFARGYGLVAWSSTWGISAISHILPASEADNRPEKGCFG